MLRLMVLVGATEPVADVVAATEARAEARASHLEMDFVVTRVALDDGLDRLLDRLLDGLAATTSHEEREALARVIHTIRELRPRGIAAPSHRRSTGFRVSQECRQNPLAKACM